LDDVFGPDEVRVTFLVEPRLGNVANDIDEINSWRSIRIAGPSLGSVLGRLLTVERQERFLKNAWRLVIEADSGTKLKLLRPTRQAALDTAAEVGAQVKTQGVSALNAYR
jgi:hypothetical protein